MGPNSKGALLALLAFAIYATHDVIVKALGGLYSPFQLIFFSVLFAFPLLMLMIIRDAKPGHLRPVHPWWTLFRTISAVITGVAAFYAFSTLPLAQTYAILFAVPLVITILSVPILGETVRLRRWMAVIVGLCGVFVVLRPGMVEIQPGHIAGLIAALTSAFASIIVRKIGKDERSVVLLIYPTMANFIVMAAFLPLVYQPMPLLHLAGIGAMSAMAFAAGLLIIAAYKTAEAVIVAPMQYSQMIWATIYGTLFFGETPDLMTLVGAAIIIASGIYIVLREGRTKASATTPVLETRTRLDGPTAPRVSSMMDATDKNASDKNVPGKEGPRKE